MFKQQQSQAPQEVSVEKTLHEKLIEAIRAENETEAQNLIELMDITELSKIDKNGDTALIWAAETKLEKVCMALIPKMSKEAINHTNKGHNTALTCAITNDLEKVCKKLISIMSYEAINYESDNPLTPGFTVSIWAVLCKHTKICEFLIPKTSLKVFIPVFKRFETEEKQFLIEILNNYINKLVKELNLILDENNAIKMIRAVKIYKKLFETVEIYEKLFKEYLPVKKIEDFKFLQNKIEEFIKNNFFTAAGVCKNLTPTEIHNDKIHISSLPNEIIINIVEYLEKEKWGLEVKTLG